MRITKTQPGQEPVETEVVLDRVEMALFLLTFNPKASPADAIKMVNELIVAQELADKIRGA